MDYIDVINELIDIEGDDSNDNDKGWQASPFTKIDDFACKMFTYSKKKFPNAILVYNDYSHESTYWRGAADKVFYFVQDLKQRSCGIDAVGFQAGLSDIPALKNKLKKSY